MEKISIKKVTLTNLDEFITLVDEHMRYEKFKLHKDSKRRLKKAIKKKEKRFQAFVAYKKKEPIAYMFLCYLYSDMLGKPTLFMESLFVAEKERGKGIGTLLIRFCIKKAKKEGCGRFEWRMQTWNKKTLKFYKKFPMKNLHEDSFRISEKDFTKAQKIN
jgi:GNAT superfamily N-acetyltransferase